MENANHEYTYEKIKDIIKRLKEKNGWGFVFLGANIDAISTSVKFGITPVRVANYYADGDGMRLNYKAVNCVVSEFRAISKIDDSWKEKIDETLHTEGKE